MAKGSKRSTKVRKANRSALNRVDGVLVTRASQKRVKFRIKCMKEGGITLYILPKGGTRHFELSENSAEDSAEYSMCEKSTLTPVTFLRKPRRKQR